LRLLEEHGGSRVLRGKQQGPYRVLPSPMHLRYRVHFPASSRSPSPSSSSTVLHRAFLIDGGALFACRSPFSKYRGRQLSLHGSQAIRGVDALGPSSLVTARTLTGCRSLLQISVVLGCGRDVGVQREVTVRAIGRLQIFPPWMSFAPALDIFTTLWKARVVDSSSRM